MHAYKLYIIFYRDRRWMVITCIMTFGISNIKSLLYYTIPNVNHGAHSKHYLNCTVGLDFEPLWAFYRE